MVVLKLLSTTRHRFTTFVTTEKHYAYVHTLCVPTIRQCDRETCTLTTFKWKPARDTSESSYFRPDLLGQSTMKKGFNGFLL